MRQHNTTKTPCSKGFTLVELLICIAILGVIAAIAVPLYRDYKEGAKLEVAVADIKNLEFELTYFRAENGRYPASLAELPGSPYIDPWGNPYQYLNIQDDNPPKGKMRKDRFLVPINSDYDLYSMGADGLTTGPLTAKHSHDDIVRANNGSFVGYGSDY